MFRVNLFSFSLLKRNKENSLYESHTDLPRWPYPNNPGSRFGNFFGSPSPERVQPSSSSTAPPAPPAALLLPSRYIPGDLTATSLHCSVQRIHLPNPYYPRKQWLPPPRARSSPAKVTCLILCALASSHR
jgi:hypothetical protein